MRRKPVAMSAAAVILALAACGSPQDQPSAPKDGSPSTSATTAGARRNSEDSVAAVLHSQGDAVASVRFTLPERPVAGQPFPMQLAVSAPQPVGGLQVTVESAELVVTPGTGELDLAAAGETVTHELVLEGTQEGLAEVIVRLTPGDGKPETLYAIPVLVGPAAQ